MNSSWSFWTCTVKKLLKINHENTKVRKHETRHRNELSALRADLENFGHRFHGLHRFLFHKCGDIYEMEILFERYKPNS